MYFLAFVLFIVVVVVVVVQAHFGLDLRLLELELLEFAVEQ
jgi:hypothetical protein